MPNNEFKIGKYYKTLGEIPSIPFGSNVIFIGIVYSPWYNTIKILYEGILYNFDTAYGLDTWLKVLDNPITTK